MLLLVVLMGRARLRRDEEREHSHLQEFVVKRCESVG